jgi:hypothetical protein
MRKAHAWGGRAHGNVIAPAILKINDTDKS